MGLMFYNGQLLFSGGQLAMDPACCCDEGGCIAGLAGVMATLDASLTVAFTPCTAIVGFEDCDLNDVTNLTIPDDALPPSPYTWYGTAIGRAGSYKCVAGDYRIIGNHLIGVQCIDDSTVRINYRSAAAANVFPGDLARLDIPFATFDPTNVHALTPQPGIPCNIDSVSVTWS